MARWEIKNVGMKGVAMAVPKNVVTTSELGLLSQEEAEVFDNTVGIKRRHIAPDTMCASDMCQAAAEKLLTELGWEKDSIDVLLFESVTGDYRTPPTSCVLQDRLGLSENCFCMDIPMGCCGCMYAITVAGNLLTVGEACVTTYRGYGLANGFRERQKPCTFIWRLRYSDRIGI